MEAGRSWKWTALSSLPSFTVEENVMNGKRLHNKEGGRGAPEGPSIHED